MSNQTQSSNVTSWSAEFNERVISFALAIGVSEDKVKSVLSELGADGTSDQSLAILENEEYLPMSDLFEAFVDSGLTKKAKLRLGVRFLRGKNDDLKSVSNISDVAQAINNMVSSNRPKTEWTDEELIKIYTDDSTDVWEILRKRSHGRHFIVFESNNSVNVSVTLELLKAAKKMPTNDKYILNGRTVRVYRVGEFLAQFLDISPFFPNTHLINDICTESGTNWKGISDEMRTLVYLHCHNVEKKQLSKIEMKRIHADAGKGIEYFRSLYDEATMLYEEKKQQDNLPKLKLPTRSDYPVNTFGTKSDSGF